MINQIYREIYVTREALKDPIFYVRGTNAIPIVLRIMDFNIPQGAQVNYYVRKPSGKSTFNAASQVSNTVTIDVKTQDFAETGFCRLQLQVISGDEVLVSFDHPVVVKENYTDSQGDESKNESNVYVMKNQGVVNSGKILGIDRNGYVTPMDYEGGGGGGTNNYNNLSNRPQINGVTLSGNKTADELKLLPKNVGSQNNGKYLRVNESGDIVPSDLNGGSQQDPDYSGKTIVMFGDSIVAGWGWQEGTGITEPLKEKYPNGTWTNQAVSGSNMANKSGSEHPSIVSKVLAYTGTANGILLEGGQMM